MVNHSRAQTQLNAGRLNFKDYYGELTNESTNEAKSIFNDWK